MQIVLFLDTWLIRVSSSCLGSVPHSQMSSNTIVTMTMASHSSHAAAVTTSAIPVGKLAAWSARASWAGGVISIWISSVRFNTPVSRNRSSASFTAKVVPQPIAHSSSRVQSDYPGERTNLIPIPGHRSSPNPVTMEARSDNRRAHNVDQLMRLYIACGKKIRERNLHCITISGRSSVVLHPCLG